MERYQEQRNTLSIRITLLEEVMLSNVKKSTTEVREGLLPYQGVKMIKHNLIMEHEENVFDITEESLYQSIKNYSKRSIESYS